MGAYQYRGESLQKDAVRLSAYSILTRQSFYRKKHVVIAGAGGDIQTLKAWGVDPRNIIACDKKQHCRRLAAEMGAIIPPDGISDDIVATTRWSVQEYGDSHIASVNNDLCDSLLTGVHILYQVAEETPAHVPLFFTFLCGHDPGLKKAKGEENPGKKRLAYFHRHMAPILGKSEVTFHPYQSWTNTSVGSPMCMAVCR